MQAITTRYLPPGNVRGSRIKAFCERGSLVLNWNHDLDATGNHVAAAKALRDRFVAEDAKRYGTREAGYGWDCPFATGATTKDYVHVFVEPGNRNVTNLSNSI